MDTLGFSIYDNCKKAEVSLSVRGEKLDIAAFTREIQIQATWSYSKGDKFVTHSGLKERDESLWGIKSGSYVDSTDPEEHARWLIDTLKGKEEILQDYINDEDFYVGVWIWWEVVDSGGSYFLTAETLRSLSRLCESANFTFLGSSDCE